MCLLINCVHVQDFLLLDELQANTDQPCDVELKQPNYLNRDVYVRVHDVKVSWAMDDSMPILHSITFDIDKVIYSTVYMIYTLQCRLNHYWLLLDQ